MQININILYPIGFNLTTITFDRDSIRDSMLYTLSKPLPSYLTLPMIVFSRIEMKEWKILFALQTTIYEENLY